MKPVLVVEAAVLVVASAYGIVWGPANWPFYVLLVVAVTLNFDLVLEKIDSLNKKG